MSSLATCIKKLGKVLSKTDVDAIREIRDELTSGGMAAVVANRQAIDEYLETLASERGELVLQIQEVGGRTEKEEITSSKLAQQDMFGADLAAQNLADETAKRDAKRNKGQEEVETGDEGDLFNIERFILSEVAQSDKTEFYKNESGYLEERRPLGRYVNPPIDTRKIVLGVK